MKEERTMTLGGLYVLTLDGDAAVELLYALMVAHAHVHGEPCADVRGVEVEVRRQLVAQGLTSHLVTELERVDPPRADAPGHTNAVTPRPPAGRVSTWANP